jgi:hypothetical protein
MKRRLILWLLLVALAVPALLLSAYFVHGSLEEFPTDEQQEKVRLVSGVGFLIFAGLEALVIAALRRAR